MQASSILIVEDEAIIALDLQAQLEEMGYRIVGVAESAAQAIRLAEQHRPTLALMDVVLKGDVDGVAAAATFNQRFAIPVIFLTSFSDVKTVRRAAQTAPYGYLTKPFQPRELRAAIEVAIYKSRIERQLKDSERWFSSTLRCVKDSVIVIEPDATVRFMNTAAEDLLGWAVEEAIGRPVGEILQFEVSREPGDTTPVVNAAIQALAERRAVGVLRGLHLRKRDGTMVPVDESAAPVTDDQGQPMGVVVVLRDISTRLEQEERLRASEERFRRTFDAAPLGMALISFEGQMVQVNQAMTEYLARPNVDLRTLRNQELSHPADLPHEQSRLNELQSGMATFTQFEKRYLAGDGRELWALVSVSVMREGDDPVCYLYQVHDLTEQKKAAEQLAQLAEERLKHEATELASRAKGEFLARMSHEMRTPLNAVMGFAQLLQMRGEQADVGRSSRYILDAARHLLALVDDVLDLQRIAEGKLNLKLRAIELDVAVSEAEQLLRPAAEAAQVRFERQFDPALSVLADETRLRQVLLNLGSNAVKYNRTQGEVRWVARASTAQQVRIEVRDSGLGMTPAQLDRLFQPFERLGRETSAVPGAGLGLMISRKLIEQMGGTLTVFSESGVGTTMVIHLPRAMANDLADGASAAAGSVPG